MGINQSKIECEKCLAVYDKHCHKLLLDDRFCDVEIVHCNQCCTSYCSKCEKHCCLCLRSFSSKNDIVHCQVCHEEHVKGYCCRCKKQYNNLSEHCCTCQIWTNITYEKHCCLCQVNHRLDFCCRCNKSWNIRLENHCCKCQLNHNKDIVHKCFGSSESLPASTNSEYDKISNTTV